MGKWTVVSAGILSAVIAARLAPAGAQAVTSGQPADAGARTSQIRQAAAKNLAFRERMVGRTLSAVTLGETGMALTENYVKVELSGSREANLLVDLKIAGVTGFGLREGSLAILQ